MASASKPDGGPVIRLAIVTNIPAPYRVPVYNLLAREPGLRLHAFYAARTESDRQWDLPAFAHEHSFLEGRVWRVAGRYIHHSPDVWRRLRAFEPHAVMTTGYNPTHLLGWLYAMSHRRAHIASTDGTDVSEAGLSLAHRLARRAVLASSGACVAASEGGHRLLRGYGVAASQIHISPLCANTSVAWPDAAGSRDIDLLFSGRLVAIKNPMFALEVARSLAPRIGRRLRLAMLGSGPLEPQLRERAAAMAADVEVIFAGHVGQAEVPAWFSRAQLFVFPTQWDPWGVVANEACLAGVPVIVSPHAGVAGELVRDGIEGRVLALQPALWVDAAEGILRDPSLHARMAAAARRGVRQYSFENAAAGIADAARQAVASRGDAPLRRSGFQRRSG